MADISVTDAGSRIRAVLPAYREAERRAALSGDFAFLGGIFDRLEAPVYLDWVHLSPLGNEIAAHTIAEQIRSSRS